MRNPSGVFFFFLSLSVACPFSAASADIGGLVERYSALDNHKIYVPPTEKVLDHNVPQLRWHSRPKRWTFQDSNGQQLSAVSSLSRDFRAGYLSVTRADLSRLTYYWDYRKEGLYVHFSAPNLLVQLEIVPASSEQMKSSNVNTKRQRDSTFTSNLHLMLSSRRESAEIRVLMQQKYPGFTGALYGSLGLDIGDPVTRMDGTDLQSPMWSQSAIAHKILDFEEKVNRMAISDTNIAIMQEAVSTGYRTGKLPNIAVVLITSLSSLTPTEESLKTGPATLHNGAASIIGCGLTCLGAVGSGIGTAVSGGTTSFALFLSAAGCGTCLGAFTEPNLPPPVFIGPGSGGPVGGTLPSLPPGYIWVCNTFGENGESVCRAVPKNAILP